MRSTNKCLESNVVFVEYRHFDRNPEHPSLAEVIAAALASALAQLYNVPGIAFLVVST